MEKPAKTYKKKRPRRTFTPEFKAEAVRLCRVGDRSIAQVAKDLDLTETALREWV
jgi:transposase